MDWTIRELGPEDAPRLMALQHEMLALHAAHRPDVFRSPASAGDMEAFLRERLESEEHFMLGAVAADGTVLGAGLVEIQQVEETALLKARRRGILHEIVTAPEARRQGVALALVEAVKRRLRAEGVPRLAATYWQFNEASAALMRRAGLEPAHSTMEGPV